MTDAVLVVNDSPPVLQVVLNTSVLKEVQLGTRGIPGKSYTETWESVAQNLRALPQTLVRDAGGLIASIIYALPDGGSVTKTIVRSNGAVHQIVLSGDLPDGVLTTKTLLRDGAGQFAGATYGSA